MKINTTNFKAHEHLANLIKNRFNVVLEIQHTQLDKHYPVRAITSVQAYRNLDDAKQVRNPVASSVAQCSWQDKFVRSKGLTTALRRLYRQLANQN